MPQTERWEPWRALRAAGEAVELRWGVLPDERGRFERYAHRDVIWIDVSLDRRTRRAVLAHELIHRERGIGEPDASAATMQREEVIVRAEVVRRLVPPAELERLAAVRPDGVTVHDVAEESDVPEGVAEAAISTVRRQAAGRHPER